MQEELLAKKFNKYVTGKTNYPSLKGLTTCYYDKFGAMLYTRNSFGKYQFLYNSIDEYLKSIKQ